MGNRGKIIHHLGRMAVLAIFFHLRILTADAQNWAPPGAVWYYSYDNLWVTGYVKIVSVGDTLITGKQYRVLQKSYHVFDAQTSAYHDTVFGEEFVYSDSNRLYIRRYERDYVLYDLSKGPGQSWTFAATWPVCDSTGEVEVDVISSATINGWYYKTMTVQAKTNSGWGWGGESPSIIIDRIGSITNYFLPDPTYLCQVPGLYEGGSLRCYHDQNMGWFYSYTHNDCEYINNLETPQTVCMSLELFPNPASHCIFLYHPLSEGPNPGMYSIYDYNGHCVMSIKATGRGCEDRLTVAGLSQGTYLCVFSNRNGIVALRKFVIIKH